MQLAAWFTKGKNKTVEFLFIENIIHTNSHKNIEFQQSYT